MGYRIIFLTNPAKLSIKNEQLLIDNGEITKIPLEDIECIMCDTAQVNLNAYLTAKLCEYAITFFVTNEKHHPCGMFLPLSRHSRHSEIINKQIQMSMPRKKQLWKSIVIQKIKNQSRVLMYSNIEQWSDVEILANRVLSGDSTNIEALVASKYFKLLYGKDFKRAEDNGINACLNYGYAILRSTIEKYLVVYGFEPALGLFHKNGLNNFNLADDIIEPFRPMVDLFVKNNITINSGLTKQNRVGLLNLLSSEIMVNDKAYALSRGIELVVQSLSRSLVEKTELDLPTIVPICQHSYE